jgi:DNA polymerase III delta subunit
MKHIYFIIGNNQTLIEDKIKEITKNYRLISLTNGDEDYFFNTLEKNVNKSLFTENKDLILRSLEKLKKEGWQRLINLVKENSSQKFILLLNEEKAEIFELFKQNKLKFEIVSLKIPKTKDLDKFIEKYAKEHNLNLSPELISFLKENYQENTDLLIYDLRNIIFLNNNNQKLKVENLKNLIHLHANIFKIHDYLLEKKWSTFIHTFKKFISHDKSYNKNETLQALSFFINSLIRIYLLKLGKKTILKLNPYYLQRLQEKARSLTLEEIRSLIKALAKTDRKLKKFIIKPNEIPEEIVLSYILTQKLGKF